MLQNYIALQEELSILQTEEIIFEKLNSVPNHIKDKFLNNKIYRVHIKESSIDKFWNIIKKQIKYEEIIEIYTCTEDEKETIERLIMNSDSNNNPELKSGTHITIGRFLIGDEINNSEKLESSNDYFHILSLSKDEEKLYIDVISRQNDREFYTSNLCNRTRRENRVNNITEKHKWINRYKKIDEDFIPLRQDSQRIKINSLEEQSPNNRVYYYENGRCGKYEKYKNMLLRYYESQDRVPSCYKGESFKILRFELKNNLENREIECIEFSQGRYDLEYELEKSVKVKIGEEECTTVEYINPYDDKKYDFHINSIERLSDIIPEQYREALEDRMSQIEEILVVLYENPNNNIDVNLYLKDYLDSKEEYSKRGIGSLVLMRERSLKGQNGYKLHEMHIEGYTGGSDEVELELFSVTNHIEKEPINFQEGINHKKPLKEVVVDISESEEEIHNKIHENFKHIRFTPETPTYCPGEHAKYDNLIDYKKIDIPMGKSRIGGPVVDLPEGIEYPEEYYFAAQLNLAEFSQFHVNEYLPKTGFLYFFTDDYCEYGEAIYSDCKVEDLKRVIKEHGQNFYSGNLIKDIYAHEENISERYSKDGECAGEWEDFAGGEKSKLFGMYTNCQFCEEEIIEQLLGENIVLLQVGEDFTECGVFTVRIIKRDLEKLDFSKCSFEWSQS